MEGFVDIGYDPYGGRTVMCLYGKPGVGKTMLFLRLVQEHKDNFVFLLSADRGTKQVRMDPRPYRGRLAIAYPNSLREWRITIRQMGEKIEALLKKGVPSHKIWIVFDTANYLQTKLFEESRKIASVGKKDKQSGQSQNSSTKVVDEADYARDILTQLDYGINLALMSELTNQALTLAANVVYIVHEKGEKDQYDRTVMVPSLSGQIGTKLMGDADIIARMVQEGDVRRLLTSSGGEFYAKDRTDRLARIEVADLHALVEKITKNSDDVKAEQAKTDSAASESKTAESTGLPANTTDGAAVNS